jgi:hypothetical protein
MAMDTQTLENEAARRAADLLKTSYERGGQHF